MKSGRALLAGLGAGRPLVSLTARGSDTEAASGAGGTCGSTLEKPVFAAVRSEQSGSGS